MQFEENFHSKSIRAAKSYTQKNFFVASNVESVLREANELFFTPQLEYLLIEMLFRFWIEYDQGDARSGTDFICNERSDLG